MMTFKKNKYKTSNFTKKKKSNMTSLDPDTYYIPYREIEEKKLEPVKLKLKSKYESPLWKFWEAKKNEYQGKYPELKGFELFDLAANDFMNMKMDDKIQYYNLNLSLYNFRESADNDDMNLVSEIINNIRYYNQKYNSRLEYISRLNNIRKGTTLDGYNMIFDERTVSVRMKELGSQFRSRFNEDERRKNIRRRLESYVMHGNPHLPTIPVPLQHDNVFVYDVHDETPTDGSRRDNENMQTYRVHYAPCFTVPLEEFGQKEGTNTAAGQNERATDAEGHSPAQFTNQSPTVHPQPHAPGVADNGAGQSDSHNGPVYPQSAYPCMMCNHMQQHTDQNIPTLHQPPYPYILNHDMQQFTYQVPPMFPQSPFPSMVDYHTQQSNGQNIHIPPQPLHPHVMDNNIQQFTNRDPLVFPQPLYPYMTSHNIQQFANQGDSVPQQPPFPNTMNCNMQQNADQDPCTHPQQPQANIMDDDDELHSSDQDDCMLFESSFSESMGY